MNWRIRPRPLSGTVTVPGDKSIGHRALMVGALAAGETRIRHLPRGEDVLSTAGCLRALGVRIEQDDGEVRVRSTGALQAPAGDLDAGNSGTTMRLLAGILAGQPFPSVLTGDASLRRRPMRRVLDPLDRMGAAIRSEEGGYAPLQIDGAALRGTSYTLPVASAQVKSAILFAGLFAEGETEVREPIPTRDHSERMLRAAGVAVERTGYTITIRAGRPAPLSLTVPGDISSAAFFLAAAALGGEEIVIPDLGINPTRTGFLTVLERMGVRIEVTDERTEAGEPRGTVRASGRVSRPVRVETEEVPLLIDELPLVALLATQAPGTSAIKGAAELRVKESDRIAAVTAALQALGADIAEQPDGWVVRGPTPLQGAAVDAGGDHRLAMMLAVAGTVTAGETVVRGAECAAVSFPSFAAAFIGLGGSLA